MIVTISLVRNENVWITRSLRNTSRFADRQIVLDNGSTDGTAQLAADCGAEVYHVDYARRTNEYIQEFIGTDCWVMGVDGDEVYDPAGLAELRGAIMAGAYNDVFQLSGRFLHVTHITDNTARGYMAPPSHPPAKLYNMRHVKSWGADDCLFFGGRELDSCVERKDISTASWDTCILRCLHMRFVRRSTEEEDIGDRFGPRHIAYRKDQGPDPNRNMRLKYRIGEEKTVDATPFLWGVS